MNGQTEAKQSPLDISYLMAKYLIPILERKWLVIAFFISGSLVSFSLSSLIKTEYYSIASLLVQEPRSKISGDKSNPMLPPTADETYVLSEAESLRSIPLVTEVLKILPDKIKDELNINLDPYQQILSGLKGMAKNLLGLKWLRFSDKKGSQTSASEDSGDISKERIAALQNRVIIKSKSKNAMIWITARTVNKYAAPIIVKSYISVWMARNLEENKKAIRIEKAFAMEQRNTAHKHLNESAKELSDFRNHYEIPPYVTPKVGLGDTELQSEFERLQSRVDGATQRFEYLDKIFLRLQMEEAGIAENIKLLDSPTSPGAPAKTVKQEILLAGILGGLGVGIGIVLGLDFLKNPIRHEKDIANAVDVPIFGYIPKI